jgi:S1-C subfamily serine protease
MLALLVAGSTALTCLSSNAQSDDKLYKYGQEGWWTIQYELFDSDNSRLCHSVSYFKDYNVTLRFLSWIDDDGERRWAISMYNDKWNLTEGKEYKFFLEAPRDKKWGITFVAKTSKRMMAFVNKDVMNSIAMDSNGSKMVFRQGNKVLGPFSLNDSAAAIRSVVHCVNDDPNRSKTAEKPHEKKKSSGGTSTGTGFFIAPGYILTNYHVVKDCTEPPMVNYPNFKASVAYSTGVDETNDLVILETKMNNHGIAGFRRVPKLGEAVASFGFPLSDVLAPEGNFTLGNITSTTGMGGDSRFIQFSAPVQNGNSGGPLMDMSGRVIGITNHFLKAPAGAAIPQNVNFAITASVAMNFMEVKELGPQMAPKTQKLDPEILAELAKTFTVHVSCK